MAKVYLGIVVLSFVGLLGIFYISTFIDLSDKLFKGQTTTLMLLAVLLLRDPAVRVLRAADRGAGGQPRHGRRPDQDERAHGHEGLRDQPVSRRALPIFLLSLVWSGLLFAMSETVLGQANRRADSLNKEIRSGVPQTIDVMQRRWVMSEGGSIYHYLSFDADTDEFGELSIYDLGGRPWTLERRTYAAHAGFEPDVGYWEGHDLWVRDLSVQAAGDGEEGPDRGLSAADGGAAGHARSRPTSSRPRCRRPS